MKRSTRVTHHLSFRDPVTGKRRSMKATRSAAISRSGFAAGGAVGAGVDPYSSAAAPMYKHKTPKKRHREVGKASGKLAVARLDKAARGARKYQFGGPVGRPALPTAAAPAAAVAGAGVPAFAGGQPPAGVAPGMGRPAFAGMGLPAQASPQALAALAARRGLPQAMGARPFKRGGGVHAFGDVEDPHLTGKGGPYSGAHKGRK
jgi:hypothetical protein